MLAMRLTKATEPPISEGAAVRALQTHDPVHLLEIELSLGPGNPSVLHIVASYRKRNLGDDGTSTTDTTTKKKQKKSHCPTLKFLPLVADPSIIMVEGSICRNTSNSSPDFRWRPITFHRIATHRQPLLSFHRIPPDYIATEFLSQTRN